MSDLRDAGPLTGTYGCASRQAQICGGPTPTRRFGKCGLTQGTRTPATTNLATRRQQCGGPTPTRRFGK